MLDRPDGTSMIAIRIVCGMIRRKGTNAPPAEHIVLQQPAGYSAGELLVNDPACQQVAWIRTDGSDLLPICIQAKRKELLIGHPISIVEALLQLRGFVKEAARQLPITQKPQYFRHPEFRHVNERLFFASRNRRLNLLTIFVNDGIPRILPALISIALRRTGFV